MVENDRSDDLQPWDQSRAVRRMGGNTAFSELWLVLPPVLSTDCGCMGAQACPTLVEPMNGSPPGSSVHGILQARILEWVAIFPSRGSSQPRDQTHVS